MTPRTTARILALAALTAPVFALVGAPSAAAAPHCRGVKPTIVGTTGNDRLVGTPGPDVIAALGGDDILVGRAGNDLLCGGRGADKLVGGSGKDRLYGQGDKHWTDRLGSKIVTGDQLQGGKADDLLDPGPRMTGGEIYEQDLVVYAAADKGVRVDLTTGPASGRAVARGEGKDRIRWHNRLGVVGSQHADHLVGSGERDYLVGLGGDDRIEGLGGADQLATDRAEISPGDAWSSSGGHDLVLGGDGKDDLHSTGGRDELHGGAANDVLSVEGGAGDKVYGDSGGDLLFVYFSSRARNLAGALLDGGEPSTGISTDTVYLISNNPGKAKVTVDAAAGRLIADVRQGRRSGRILGWEEHGLSSALPWSFVGSDIDDWVFLDSGGRLNARGGGGDDFLIGGTGRNRLAGGDGDDTLNGGPADDVLRGDAGRDELRGKAGTDTCRTGERVSGCER